MTMDHKSTLKWYEKFCADKKTIIPLFYNSWYLDAACGSDNWGVAIYKTDHDIVQAIWPYHMKSKLGLNYITMPSLTPYLGPWILTSDIEKEVYVTGERHKILTELNKKIPKVSLCRIHSHPDQSNLLALQWSGYKEYKRYTYRLDLKKEHIWQELNAKQRNIIRKAGNRLKINQSYDIDKFYQYNKFTFERQSMDIPYSLEKIRSLYSELSTRGCCTLLEANDKSKNNTHGMILLGHDSLSVYLLAIGSIAELRNQGCIPLLIWEAISMFRDSHQIFDFEGSMIPRIERFFRSFGGALTPYSRLFKAKNIGIELLLKLSGRDG